MRVFIRLFMFIASLLTSLEPAGEMVGTWRQAGASLPLTLTRAAR